MAAMTAVSLLAIACAVPEHAQPVPAEQDLSVILDTPAEAGEGQAFDVRWSGPDHLGATISVNRIDDPPGTSIVSYSALKARRNFERTVESAAGKLAVTRMAAPPVAGDYEIRYTRKLPNVILARRPLRVTASRYTLAAPDSVAVSSPIKVEWTGTLTAGDFVTLVPKGYAGLFDNARYAKLQPGQPAQLTTPATPGEYEIRYIMNASYSKREDMRYAVKQSIPIIVTDITASVSGPSSAVGGSTIDVSWQSASKSWRDDVLSVVARGSDVFNRDSWARLVDGGNAANPVSLRVPAIEGDYDIAYVLVPGERIVARAPLTVARAQASVEAPDNVPAGRDFRVRYSGDGFAGDRIVVVRADLPDDKMWGVPARYGFAADASRNEGIVPGSAVTRPGDYEVRYVTGLQHQVLARDPVTVTE